MMPVRRFVFSRSTWWRNKENSYTLQHMWASKDILLLRFPSPGSTLSGCCGKETRRWSFPAYPVGQTEGATWRYQCPTCGKSWMLKAAHLRSGETSFPEPLCNLPCLNKLWIESRTERRREGKPKRQKEKEGEKMNTPKEKTSWLHLSSCKSISSRKEEWDWLT